MQFEKQEKENEVEVQERKIKITGALILIVLGILIILNTMGVYEFSKSWPILLIVVAIATLTRKSRDLGGWFIGIVGVLFFIIKNFYDQIENAVAYIFPILLILLGAYLIAEQVKRHKTLQREDKERIEKRDG
jgi:predicted membrane protein